MAQTLVVGGDHADGKIVVRNVDNQDAVRLQALSSQAELLLGGKESNGRIELFSGDARNVNAVGVQMISLNAGNATITAGGKGGAPSGEAGRVVLNGAKGEDRIRLDADRGNLWLGGNDANGDLMVFSSAGDNHNEDEATIRLNGKEATIVAGDANTNGKVVLRGGQAIRLDTANGISATHLWLGGRGQPGLIALFPDNVNNRTSTVEARIIIDGDSGDIVLQNADCAEDFDLAGGEEVVPGAVMVLDEDGSLRQSEREYDTAVAGVVSGAGTFQPGIVLGRRESSSSRVPIAMVGKVFCLVDADFGPVRPGTLLTTSPRRGHAMSVSDSGRAFGAVIGKALKPLSRGQALVPVMIALQ